MFRLLLALLLCVAAVANGFTPRVAPTWCIANPLVSSTNLKRDIDKLCSTKVDCSSIKPGGLCYLPNDVESHASVVFNLYYKAHSSQGAACLSFGGDSLLSLTDPSSGTCVYH